MKGNPKVIDYLNKALRHELTAVNQYWLHYRMLDNWGYKVLAKQWRKESIEEMQHADKLIERIIFLDGLPNMQTLESLHIGQTVKEVLERDLQAEMEARALYEESATHCHSVKDYVTRDLFEQLMHDEEHHIDFLETQLDLVASSDLSSTPNTILVRWARMAKTDLAGHLVGSDATQCAHALTYDFSRAGASVVWIIGVTTNPHSTPTNRARLPAPAWVVVVKGPNPRCRKWPPRKPPK